MKNGLIFCGKILILTIAMVICSAIASRLTLAGIITTTAAEPGTAGQAALILILVSLGDVLLITLFILRSRWHKVQLAIMTLLFVYGIQTFMSQIETWYFHGAMKVPAEMLQGFFLNGLVKDILFIPLAILILDKSDSYFFLNRRPVTQNFSGAQWLSRFFLLGLVYVVIYFLFGYFIAWQYPAVREFYTGSTALEGFIPHMIHTVSGDPFLPLFQFLRGILWTGLGLVAIYGLRGKIWQVSLCAGVLFGLLFTTQLLFPNPLMPGPVRMAHFLETSTSTFLFGCFIPPAFLRSSDIYLKF